MACYHPLEAFRSLELNANGKRTITFKKNEGHPFLPLKIACGQCIGCRLDRSRQWAIRCMHESSLYRHNAFVTLTYNDRNLPWDGSLKKKDFQNFMKALRRGYTRDSTSAIRYYHCGEYGDRTRRPHYHAIIFNIDFDDKEIWKKNTRTGETYYTSEKLNRIWGKGYCVIGDVSFQSAAYVARYILKKINGHKASEHYTKIIDHNTGECVDLQPEYTTMSRRPGIGRGWYEKYKGQLQPDDFVVWKGKKHKIPKYYDHLYELENSKEFEIVKERRIKHASKDSIRQNNTPDRLSTREYIQKKKLERLIRPEL